MSRIKKSRVNKQNNVKGSMVSPDELKQNSWIEKRWRPVMAWSYMIICLFDFIMAPILWSILQASYKGNVTDAWTPLTLQGAGLFHLAMGAILGVTAWSRGQEKMTMMNGSMYRQPSSSMDRDSAYTSGSMRRNQHQESEEEFSERER